MGVFSKSRMGKLRVVVEYTTRYNFSLTVRIRELKLQEPITFEGKVFEVPAGTYTVALKGLMHDPSYGGDYHHVYKGVYGSFERSQRILVNADTETTCTFELPGETFPVAIRVVSGELPVVGAEVLIREVDPNSKMTREGEGAQFFLTPGTYTVVVTHGSALMKEAIHVSEQETEFTLDISRQMAIRASRVVVRYQDGRMVKGVTEDFAPGKSEFSVIQHHGKRVTIRNFEGVKAVFFVKSLDGNRLYAEQKDFAIANQFGQKTIVVFRDKEEISGYTLIGHADQPAFFLFPVDRQSNNLKVLVIRDSVVEIRFA
ncbi:MAG TPA: hypothetical protein VLM91_20110 [Candidatus Methylomirabilis sp.]|nr:hypothetical protein [Candidatus Methylomirabilis sp.]